MRLLSSRYVDNLKRRYTLYCIIVSFSLHRKYSKSISVSRFVFASYLLSVNFPLPVSHIYSRYIFRFRRCVRNGKKLSGVTYFCLCHIRVTFTCVTYVSQSNASHSCHILFRPATLYFLIFFSLLRL